jgi:hypothetical protein
MAQTYPERSFFGYDPVELDALDTGAWFPMLVRLVTGASITVRRLKLGFAVRVNRGRGG